MDNLPKYVRFPLNIVLSSLVFGLIMALIVAVIKLLASLGPFYGLMSAFVLVLAIIFSCTYESDLAKEKKTKRVA